jgi:putative transposase
MPQSLANVLVHLVFSTKNRRASIVDAVRSDLHAFLAGAARSAGCECLRVGGIEDHVHLAIRLSRTVSIAALVEDLKTSSSKWMKSRSPDHVAFAWQRGYGAFSVGPRDADAVVAYIDRQVEHHRSRTFQDEYRALLERCGVEYDERFVWD